MLTKECLFIALPAESDGQCFLQIAKRLDTRPLDLNTISGMNKSSRIYLQIALNANALARIHRLNLAYLERATQSTLRYCTMQHNVHDNVHERATLATFLVYKGYHINPAAVRQRWKTLEKARSDDTELYNLVQVQAQLTLARYSDRT